MKKVVKFGGSSLASAEQFKKVGEIIRKDPARRYVVPSAPGKRFSGDTKVTDMLYSCYGAAIKEKEFTEQLVQIQERYQEIIDGLGLTLSLMQVEQGDKYLMTKQEIENKIAVYTGGRAAEELVFGEITTGDRKSTRLNSSHEIPYRMPSSA